MLVLLVAVLSNIFAEMIFSFKKETLILFYDLQLPFEVAIVMMKVWRVTNVFIFADFQHAVNEDL